MTVRTVRRDTAGPGMESLTSCQTNRTTVVVRTVRRDTAGHGMESLTTCQANRTRVAVRTVRRDTQLFIHSGSNSTVYRTQARFLGKVSS